MKEINNRIVHRTKSYSVARKIVGPSIFLVSQTRGKSKGGKIVGPAIPRTTPIGILLDKDISIFSSNKLFVTWVVSLDRPLLCNWNYSKLRRESNSV